MGAHYRHTTPEMAARIATAIEQRLRLVLEVAERALEGQMALRAGVEDAFWLVELRGTSGRSSCRSRTVSEWPSQLSVRASEKRPLLFCAGPRPASRVSDTTKRDATARSAPVAYHSWSSGIGGRAAGNLPCASPSILGNRRAGVRHGPDGADRRLRAWLPVPEAFSVEDPDGVAMDVFSPGALAFLLLAGQPPSPT
jgi:hypothetical protein